MNPNRRRWLYGIGSVAFLGMAPNCQANQQQPKGKLWLTDENDKGLEDWEVDVMPPMGNPKSKRTNKEGYCEFDIPQFGPYRIQIFDRQGGTPQHVITQLTANVEQVAHLSFDSRPASFTAIYNAMQAIDSTLAWVVEGSDDFVRRLDILRSREINGVRFEAALDVLTGRIAMVKDNAQRELLLAKDADLRKMLPIVFARVA